MKIRNLKFLAVGDRVTRGNTQVTITELDLENQFVSYFDGQNVRYTTAEVFFEEEVNL